MARRATTPLESSENVRVKFEKVKVKEEKNKGKTRARIEEDETEHAAVEGEDARAETSNNEEDTEENGSPRGSKRRRTNGEGDSAPSGSGSHEDNNEDLPRVKTLPRGEDGYIPGSIVRIKLQNFVTYDAVEFRPGPYLNMIIGPNGTGKSSISCAIALGLNFSPSILGRATELHSYVKHGASSGSIEIELKAPNNKRNIVIRRVLTANVKGSTFTINGASASGKEVTNKVGELNVQVGNLCSFLPQDRVSEFAAMSPYDLLKETQRAAGDENLTRWHKTLISAGSDLRLIQQKIKDEENSLRQMIERNEGIERDVQRYLERERIQFEIHLLEVLIPVAEYREIRVHYARLKRTQRKLLKKLTKLKEKNKPVVDLIKQLEGDLKDAEEERDRLKKSTQHKFKSLEKKDTDSNGLAASAEKVMDDLSDLKKTERSRQDQMANLEHKIVKERKNIQDAPVPDPEVDTQLRAELAQLQVNNQAYTNRRTTYNEEMGDLTNQRARLVVELEGAEKEMVKLNSVDNQKLAKVRSMDSTTCEAIEWLRNNRSLFKMDVFETPIMRLDINNRKYTDAVESCFSFNQLKTFVTLCQEDCDTLNKHINDDQVLGKGKKINTWFRPINPDDILPPPMSDEEMQQLGFDGYAIDYVECPPEMRWFLMREVGLHRVAISLKEISENNINTAMDYVARPVGSYGGGATFVNGRTSNAVTRSRYGKRAINNMTRDLNPARAFTVPMVDPEAKRKVDEIIKNCKMRIDMIDSQKKELQKKQNELDKELKDFEERVAAIKKRRQEITEQQKLLSKMKSSLAAMIKSLKDLKSKPPPEKRKKELEEQLKKINQRRAKIAKEYLDLAQAIIDEQEQCTKAGLRYLQINANKQALEQLSATKNVRLSQVTQQCNAVHAEYNQCKEVTVEILARTRTALKEVPDKVREAYEKIEDATCDYNQRVKDAQAQGLPLPDDETIEKRSSDELRAELETQRANLEMNLGANPGVVEQYEKRKRDIEQLEATLAQRKKEEEKIAKNIKNARDNWEPALRELVSSIGQKFSAAFDRIGCAGEIRISENEDYDKWAIDILVKFRDSEKLQLLTAHRQSGGERSLTTILYLMSLTEEARAPFSLVDEINQGMDQRAERVVHNSMVNVTCKPDSTQYFLITPKLLPDLEYHERMKILCVNNGEWLPENCGGAGKMMDMIKAYEAAKRQQNGGSSRGGM
ncbi:P-loop containing nucleoside triphosphate hydrolase protein [Agrocybe pediades]|nr:P-loop containing nucleoside triphosphate hydrolase protein [Agrocybe pediades]